MMSVSNGIVKLKREGDKWLFNIVKHPRLGMTSFEMPIEAEQIRFKTTFSYDPNVMKLFFQSFFGKGIIRRESGNFVNLFWPNLAHWSDMLWDPIKFPKIASRADDRNAYLPTKRITRSCICWFDIMLLGPMRKSESDCSNCAAASIVFIYLHILIKKIHITISHNNSYMLIDALSVPDTPHHTSPPVSQYPCHLST